MADLAAAVAALVPGRAVPRDVTTLVAVVAGHVQVPIALLRAVAGQVAALVAVVAARVVRRQAALACDVAASVATVAPVQVLLAVTCKVAHLVALVALLAASTATELAPVSAGSTGAATAASANVLAVPGVVSRPVTLEARISGHFPLDSYCLSLCKLFCRRLLFCPFLEIGSCCCYFLLATLLLTPLLSPLLPTPPSLSF